MSQSARFSGRTSNNPTEPPSGASPDQALLARIEQALASSPYLPLRSVTCYLHEGVLTLRGRVPTFYCKQLAQSLVSVFTGVEEVNNQLEVVGPGRR